MNGLVVALLATASTASAFSAGFSPAGSAHPRSAVTVMHASAPFQIPRLRPATRAAEVQDKSGALRAQIRTNTLVRTQFRTVCPLMSRIPHMAFLFHSVLPHPCTVFTRYRCDQGPGSMTIRQGCSLHLGTPPVPSVSHTSTRTQITRSLAPSQPPHVKTHASAW